MSSIFPASLLWGCGSAVTSTGPISAQSTSSESIALPLDRSTESMATVTLPESTYQEAEVTPSLVDGNWWASKSIRIWETALPIRSRYFSIRHLRG